MDHASLLIMLEISVTFNQQMRIYHNIFKNTERQHGLDLTSSSSVRSETCRSLVFFLKYYCESNDSCLHILAKITEI